MIFYRDYSIMEHHYSILELSSFQPKENSEAIVDNTISDLVYDFFLP
jgi:hypothetical protein